MKLLEILQLVTATKPDIALLFFRVAVCLELIFVHGLKKVGVGVPVAEIVPNPFGIPVLLNQAFAIGANLVCPLFIIFGFLTRVAAIPVVAVTLSGYLLVHFHDSLAQRDIPFMYSVAFLFLMLSGPGRYSLDNQIARYFSQEDDL